MTRSRFWGVSRVPLWLLAAALALTGLHTAAAKPPLHADSGREQLLTRRIENNPKSAQAYDGRANFYLNSGQFDKALADCAQAIRLDPQFAWPYNNRGVAYVAKRDFDRALAAYDRASELDPTYAFPYNNRAVIWNELGLYRKAIAECNRALELEPDYVNPLVHRGEAYARLGNLRQAVADLALAFCLDPEYGPQSIERIDTDPQRKYVDGTVAEWTVEINNDPENPQAYVKRAFSYLDEYQLREAVIDLRKADQLRAAAAQAGRLRIPAFNFTPVDTTVSVPDRGTILTTRSGTAAAQARRLRISGAERRTADDAFQAALVAAVHRFAEAGELDHLRAIAEKHPKVIDARQTFRQPHKPLRTDAFTPLHHAAERGWEKVVAYLLEKRADVNRATGTGWTPLHLAAKQGHLSIVKLLVKHGANVQSRTKAFPERFGVLPSSPRNAEPEKSPAIPSRTALECAEENERHNVVQFLKTAGK